MADMSLFIIGHVNEMVYDSVYEFFFVSKDRHEQYSKEELLNEKEIEAMMQAIVECLRMLSTDGTCNIVKFNSCDHVPEISYKKLCRGQIELIKRVVTDDHLLDFTNNL